MDFLNKAFAQIVELFRSMTPAARLTSGLLLAVIVVSLGYLFTYQVSGPDQYLMNGEPFPAAQIPAMEAAFAKAGLTSWKVDGNRIRIPRGKKSEYMAALAEAKALPPNFYTYMDQAEQGGSSFEPRAQREQRIKTAKEKELALIIRSFQGISDAAVHYDIDTKQSFPKSKIVTASVSVRPTNDEELRDEQVDAIRYMVARSIAHLKPEDVAVTNLATGRVRHTGGPDGSGNVNEDPYAKRKRMYEDNWRNKILEALSYVPGITVTLNVELNRERVRHTEEVQHDPKPVAFWTTDKSESKLKEGGDSGARPGYVAQGNTAATLAATTSKGPKSEEEASEREERAVVSSTRAEMEELGLTPRRATVAVGVPTSYVKKIWHERNPTGPEEEPKTPDQNQLNQVAEEVRTKIRTHVANLLPVLDATTDPADLVTVTMFEEIHPPAAPEPTMSETAVSWLGQYWQTIGTLGLALFSLVMLRSMIRSSVTPEGDDSLARLFAEEEGEEGQEGTSEMEHRLGRFARGSMSLRDELAELVQEDPDAAANILRTWIGTPANKPD